VALPEKLVYKSAMLSDVPNLVFVFGYTNSSWTLKLDLVCDYVQTHRAYGPHGL
jgi:monooxygenase